MARLAIRRDDLRDRNANLPTELPAVWATLGYPVRAESLAASISDPKDRASALTRTMRALAAARDWASVLALVQRAEGVFPGITDLPDITDLTVRLRAQAELASESTATGDLDKAEVLVRTISDPPLQARLLAALVRESIVAEKYDLARTITVGVADPVRKAHLVALIAQEMARQGRYDEAEQIAANPHYIKNPERRARALAELVPIIAENRDFAKAEAIADPLQFPYYRVLALADLAKAMASASEDRIERARMILNKAQLVLGKITNVTRHVEASRRLVRARAATGDHDIARTLVENIDDPNVQAQTWVDLVGEVVAAGDPDTAVAISDRAEVAIAKIDNTQRRVRVLAELVLAVATAGHPDRAGAIADTAENIAATIPDPEPRAVATTTLAAAVARAGDRNRAGRIVGTIADPDRWALAMIDLAKAVAAVGEHAAATAMVCSLPRPDQQAKGLTALAEATAATATTGTGEHQQAEAYARDAETAARTIPGSTPASALKVLALALLRARDHDLAETVAQAIHERYQHATTLAAVTEAFTKDVA
ncbi:MAG: hypothetical protein ACRD0H_16055, partial [Actinomycetes bacterium]